MPGRDLRAGAIVPPRECQIYGRKLRMTQNDLAQTDFTDELSGGAPTNRTARRETKAAADFMANSLGWCLKSALMESLPGFSMGVVHAR